LDGREVPILIFEFLSTGFFGLFIGFIPFLNPIEVSWISLGWKYCNYFGLITWPDFSKGAFLIKSHLPISGLTSFKKEEDWPPGLYPFYSFYSLLLEVAGKMAQEPSHSVGLFFGKGNPFFYRVLGRDFFPWFLQLGPPFFAVEEIGPLNFVVCGVVFPGSFCPYFFPLSLLEWISPFDAFFDSLPLFGIFFPLFWGKIGGRPHFD